MNEPISIKIHSVTDLITNSSTVIYTYSEGSLQSVKDLVNVMFQTLNYDYTFDEVFHAVVLCAYDRYLNSDSFNAHMESKEEFSTLWDKIMIGEAEVPAWMAQIRREANYNGCYPDTNLYLTPKSERYQELSNKLLNFLYSTSHEASYDG